VQRLGTVTAQLVASGDVVVAERVLLSSLAVMPLMLVSHRRPLEGF